MSVKIFLDSGAFSFYNLMSKAVSTDTEVTTMGRSLRHSRLDNFDYVKSAEYKEYRQSYVDFVKENEALLEVYPNLDVIGNAELTYANQKWLEKKGLKPAPVWHMGSDKKRKWLKLYLSEGYDYLCIGGMVGSTKAMLRPALDQLWRKYLTDKAGMPLLKVHGFGMTAFELMYRYPWFSVDSKSWIDYSMRGGILVPSYRGGKKDFLYPYVVYFTARKMEKVPNHYRTLSDGKRRGVDRYLKELGVPLGRSHFRKVPQGYELKKGEQWAKLTEDGPGEVESVVEPGVSNNQLARLDVNLRLYREIEAAVPEWPWALPKTIKRGKRGLF